MNLEVLQVSANQRVDLGDFLFGTQRTVLDGARQTAEAVMCSPATPLQVLRGFVATSPGAGQIRVGNGSAIMALRYNGEILYGVAFTGGPSERILDVSNYTPGTYGVYIRLSLLPVDPGSRAFWDASSGGSEFVQTVPTKLRATWDMRVELGSPGAEWMRVSTFLLPSMSLIYDKRPFLFEGDSDTNYARTWGSVIDRNTYRGAQPIGDLQTFVQAMYACLEDIKGRGLRKWCEKSIGGMNLGFDADPVESRLAIGGVNLTLAEITGSGAVKRTLGFHGTRQHSLSYNDSNQFLEAFSRVVLLNSDRLSSETSAGLVFSNQYVTSASAYPNGQWVFGAPYSALSSAKGLVNVVPSSLPALAVSAETDTFDRGLLLSGGPSRYVECKQTSSLLRYRLAHINSDTFGLRRHDDTSGVDSTGYDLLVWKAGVGAVLNTPLALTMTDTANARSIFKYTPSAGTLLESNAQFQIKDTVNARDVLLYDGAGASVVLPDARTATAKSRIFKTSPYGGQWDSTLKTSFTYVSPGFNEVAIITGGDGVFVQYFLPLVAAAQGTLTAVNVTFKITNSGTTGTATGYVSVNKKVGDTSTQIGSTPNYSDAVALQTATISLSQDLAAVDSVFLRIFANKPGSTGVNTGAFTVFVYSVSCVVSSNSFALPAAA